MKIPYVFIIVLLVTSLSISAQKQSGWSHNKIFTVFQAPDQFYLNGVRHLINHSPLKIFENYDKIYPKIPIVEINRFGISGDQIDRYGQKYYPIWVEKDSTLYLSDILFYIGKESVEKFYPFNEAYNIIESLTGKSFKKDIIFPEKIPQSELGVLKADWVTDWFYIKRAREINADGSEQETFEEWKKEPVKKITFKNGKLISIEEM